MPSGSATAIATLIAHSARIAVSPKRREISRTTGCPERNDVPRSPRATPPRNDPYCTRSGRSSPRLVRSRVTSSAVAPSPSIACAGSPGTRWINGKTRVATPSSTGIASINRRTRERATPPILVPTAASEHSLHAFEPQPLDDLQEALAADAQRGRGRLPAAGGTRQRGTHEAPLELDPRIVERGTGGLHRTRDVRRQQRRRQPAASRTVDGEGGNHVLQFADVARP